MLGKSTLFAWMCNGECLHVGQQWVSLSGPLLCPAIWGKGGGGDRGLFCWEKNNKRSKKSFWKIFVQLHQLRKLHAEASQAEERKEKKKRTEDKTWQFFVKGCDHRVKRVLLIVTDKKKKRKRKEERRKVVDPLKAQKWRKLPQKCHHRCRRRRPHSDTAVQPGVSGVLCLWQAVPFSVRIITCGPGFKVPTKALVALSSSYWRT